MIEIKNIVFTNSDLNCIKCFLCFINYLLPLRLKFLSESFVALDETSPLGLVTFSKDSKSSTRFKITKLILEEDSYSIAHRLVNYVIERYRASGAHSFYAVVDEKQADLINIFNKELNFRACGCEYLYKVGSINTSYSLFLKPFKKENINDICAFYNESINSFNRFLFSRMPHQFYNGCARFVFYNDNEDKILGYFEVSQSTKHDFYINFSIDFAYNIYLIDAIKFIHTKIKQKNKNFNLYIKIKDYFMNSKELIAILKENGFEFVSKSRILARDYYREVKDESLFKGAKIIFNDPTIA